MATLFSLPQGYVFVNAEGEKFYLHNEEFSPTDIDTDGLDQINIDTTIQAVVNNAQMKFDEIKAEIICAIENPE